MKGYSNLGDVPLLGVEAEVLGWPHGIEDNLYELKKNSYTYPTYFDGNHNWHCGCDVCLKIGSYMMDPVRWKRQNDGTLPSGGAEFISSRFPSIKPAIDQVVEALGMIGADSYDPKEVEFTDKYDRKSEVGLHIHASVPLSQIELKKQVLQDAVRVFYLYYPELLRLSSAYGRCRSIHYRWPKYDLNMHHNFLTITKGGNSHLEWRLFEADITNESYMRAALWLTSALTRVVKSSKLMFGLEGIGAATRWDMDLYDHMYKFDGVRDNEVDGQPIDERSETTLEYVNSHYSEKRLDALEAVVMKLLSDIGDDVTHVQALFEKARVMA